MEQILDTSSIGATIAVLGMAIVTYALRLSGLLLSSHLPNESAGIRILKSLPGTLIVSIVAPSLLNGGLLSIAAAFGTVLLAALSRSLLISMAGGIAIMAFGRYFFY